MRVCACGQFQKRIEVVQLSYNSSTKKDVTRKVVVGWASVLTAHSSPFGNYDMPREGRKKARMGTEGSNQINLERPNVPQLVLSSVAVLSSLSPNAHFS